MPPPHWWLYQSDGLKTIEQDPIFGWAFHESDGGAAHLNRPQNLNCSAPPRTRSLPPSPSEKNQESGIQPIQGEFCRAWRKHDRRTELKTLREQLLNAAFEAGGSFKTRDGRQIAVARFHDFLKTQNIQIRTIEQIKGKYIQAYVEFRKTNGIGKRTLQNEVTALRCTLRAAGRNKLAEQFDNKALGISGASRDGTKTAMSDSRFATLRAAVFALDHGVCGCIELERALGLRAEEAVKSCKSLASWAKQLASGKPVHVIFGTKGGRPRLVHPANRQRAMEAVQAAQELAACQNGVLINKPDEKSAMNRYKNVMTSAGFKGKESGHALRYAFARDQIEAYLDYGYSKTEALALTSADLGHGDGRGRYIAQVYAR